MRLTAQHCHHCDSARAETSLQPDTADLLSIWEECTIGVCMLKSNGFFFFFKKYLNYIFKHDCPIFLAKKFNKGASVMAQQVQVHVPSLITEVPCPGPTW